MTEVVKQRIVGGIVLGALAVILIPMVLDFSQDPRSQAVYVEVPPAPEPRKMAVLPLQAWSRPAQPEIKPETMIEKPAGRPPATKPVKQSKQKQTEPKAAPQAKASADKEDARAWVVQLASFSQESKAMAFRDKLRKKGYTAFVVRGEGASGAPLYRVRVGPELLYTRIEEMKTALKKETRMEGLIMRYQ